MAAEVYSQNGEFFLLLKSALFASYFILFSLFLCIRSVFGIRIRIHGGVMY